MRLMKFELLSRANFYSISNYVLYMMDQTKDSRTKDGSLLVTIFVLLFLSFTNSINSADSLDQRPVNSSLNQNGISGLQKALSQRLDTLNRTVGIVLESPILNINSSTIETLLQRSRT